MTSSSKEEFNILGTYLQKYPKNLKNQTGQVVDSPEIYTGGKSLPPLTVCQKGKGTHSHLLPEALLKGREGNAQVLPSLQPSFTPTPAIVNLTGNQMKGSLENLLL